MDQYEQFVMFSFKGIKTQLNKDGIEKKVPIGMPTWQKITETTIVKGHKGFGIICGKLSNITVFDFDDIDSYDQMIQDHPELEKCLRVKTLKGYHIYFKYDQKVLTTTNGLINYNNVDIRNDGSIVFCPPCKYVLLNGSVVCYELLDGKLINVPDYLLNELKSLNAPAKPAMKVAVKKLQNVEKVIVGADEANDEDEDIETDNESEEDNPAMIKEVELLLKCLNDSRATNYHDWIKIGMIVKQVLGISGLALYDNFSKRCKSKYDKAEVKRVYNTLKSKDLSIGSLHYYAKMDNIELYMKSFNKFDWNVPFTTSLVAQHFSALYSDRFIYSDRQLYCYNGIYWKPEEAPFPTLHNFIKNEYYSMLFKSFQKHEELVILKCDDTKDDSLKRIEKIRCSLLQLRNYGKREEFIREILCDLTQEVEFDSKTHLFAFNNKILDLDLNLFVEPNPLDYISLTTGYDFDENYDNAERMQELDQLLDTIFPDPTIKQYHLTIMSTALCGMNTEKFVIHTGLGGNGKGLSNELVVAMLGDYAYVLPSNVLCMPIKQGCNPEIASMHNKRFVVSTEPDEGYKLNTATIKELTGGNQINARMAYSNRTKTVLRMLFVMEANNVPKMDAVNDAVLRRLEIVPFQSSFISKEDYDLLDEENKTNVYVGNKYYKTIEFRHKYRQALFMILRDSYQIYKKNGIIKPIVAKSECIDYLATSDDIFSWVLDKCEQTKDVKDTVKLKELYDLFKCSEYYVNLSKMDKRNYNKKYFCNKIQTNMFLKKYCATDKDKTMILTHFILKEDDY